MQSQEWQSFHNNDIYIYIEKGNTCTIKHWWERVRLICRSLPSSCTIGKFDQPHFHWFRSSMKKTSSYSQASIYISRIHWSFHLLLPAPTFLDCYHPALTQSECEGNVPTAYTFKHQALFIKTNFMASHKHVYLYITMNCCLCHI